MKRVLCIDGGGMRGFIPAALLVELERRAQRTCAELFDLIAGTSIGGILALLLASGTPASEAIKFFTEDGKIIFKKHWWRASGFFLPRYPAAPLERILRKRLYELSLSDCKTKALVTALELKSQSPWFFKNIGSGYQNEALWRAARATSAAQTYFPAYRKGGASGDCVFCGTAGRSADAEHESESGLGRTVPVPQGSGAGGGLSGEGEL